MKLKVGTAYKSRNGDKVTINKDDDHCLYPFDADNGLCYTIHGRVWDGQETPEDLIAEWHEEPTVGEWAGWNGGPCPVHPETVVEVQWPLNKETHKTIGEHMTWQDTCLYRVITPYVEPKKAREWWIAERDGKMVVVHCHVSDAVHVREVLDDE